MIEIKFPENPIEPWHAVFVYLEDPEEGPQITGYSLAYRAASNYGSDIINMGFSKYFCLVAEFNHDNQFEVHCIPHNKNGFAMADYRLKLKLDGK
jgi:hypothetical protein